MEPHDHPTPSTTTPPESPSTIPLRPDRITPPSPEEVTAAVILDDLVAAWDATQQAETVAEITTACQWLREAHDRAQRLIIAGLHCGPPSA